MFTFVSIIHVMMSIILIVIVLLQSGKGSDLASAFGGGGSQTIFGGQGAASFLNKLTTIAAIMFMVTSLTLAILSATPEKSFMDDFEVAEEATEASAPLTGPEENALPTEEGQPVVDEGTDAAGPAIDQSEAAAAVQVTTGQEQKSQDAQTGE